MLPFALAPAEGVSIAILITCAVWVLAHLTFRRMPDQRRTHEENVALYLIQVAILGAIIVTITAWLKGSI